MNRPCASHLPQRIFPRSTKHAREIRESGPVGRQPGPRGCAKFPTMPRNFNIRRTKHEPSVHKEHKKNLSVPKALLWQRWRSSGHFAGDVFFGFVVKFADSREFFLGSGLMASVTARNRRIQSPVACSRNCVGLAPQSPRNPCHTRKPSGPRQPEIQLPPPIYF